MWESNPSADDKQAGQGHVSAQQSTRTRKPDKSARANGCFNLNTVEKNVRKLRRGSFVRRSDVVRVVHRHQNGLVRLAKHAYVFKVDISNITSSASLRLEMNQWPFGVRLVAWPHHNVFERDIPHSTTLLAT